MKQSNQAKIVLKEGTWETMKEKIQLEKKLEMPLNNKDNKADIKNMEKDDSSRPVCKKWDDTLEDEESGSVFLVFPVVCVCWPTGSYCWVIAPEKTHLASSALWGCEDNMTVWGGDYTGEEGDNIRGGGQ